MAELQFRITRRRRYFVGGGWGAGGSGNAGLGISGGGNSDNCLAISGGTVPPASLSNWAAKRSRGANFNAFRSSSFASFGWPVHQVMETEQETPFRRRRMVVDVLLQRPQLRRVRLQVAVDFIDRRPVGRLAERDDGMRLHRRPAVLAQGEHA